jgi:hypothetical protein
MLSTLKNLFHRPAIRMGRVDNSRIQTTRIRNAQFISFVAETGSLVPFNTDRYDIRLRRQKTVKGLITLAVVGGLAWIVIESARALSMF